MGEFILNFISVFLFRFTSPLLLLYRFVLRIRRAMHDKRLSCVSSNCASRAHCMQSGHSMAAGKPPAAPQGSSAPKAAPDPQPAPPPPRPRTVCPSGGEESREGWKRPMRQARPTAWSQRAASQVQLLPYELPLPAYPAVPAQLALPVCTAQGCSIDSSQEP